LRLTPTAGRAAWKVRILPYVAPSSDITCSELPPAIPTHPAYTLDKDDGNVVINNMTYPSLARTQDLRLTSGWNQTDLPRNYLANLTYSCGAARAFTTGETDWSLTCRWSGRWSSRPELPDCEWTACLRPPAPPLSSRLRIHGWLGAPLPFGSMARYVCDRGEQFQEDPAREEVTYSCQSGLEEGVEPATFDTPAAEEDWPRCALGRSVLSRHYGIHFPFQPLPAWLLPKDRRAERSKCFQRYFQSIL
jgi:hypothetical protein